MLISSSDHSRSVRNPQVAPVLLSLTFDLLVEEERMERDQASWKLSFGSFFFTTKLNSEHLYLRVNSNHV